MQQLMGESDDGPDATGQAVEILASLASLGISPVLRERVKDALSQLDQATSVAVSQLEACGVTPALSPPSRMGEGPPRTAASRGGTSRDKVSVLQSDNATGP